MKTLKNISPNVNVLAVVFVTLNLFFVTGCIDDVDNVPTTEPKLVLYSFITPGDTVKVKVQKSNPLSYNQPSSAWNELYPIITEAVVTFRNTNTAQFITIPYNEEHDLFILLPNEYLIETGQEYEIKVSATGLKDVVARTLVPTESPDFKVNTIKIIGSANDPRLQIIGSVKDVPGEENYYSASLISWSSYYDEWADTTYYYQNYMSRYYFSDIGKDGEEVGFRLETWSSQVSDILVIIQSVDYNYYRYHKHLDNLYYDDPFSEPAPLYSNVQGGLGVFSSYMQASEEIELNLQ